MVMKPKPTMSKRSGLSSKRGVVGRPVSKPKPTSSSKSWSIPSGSKRKLSVRPKPKVGGPKPGRIRAY